MEIYLIRHTTPAIEKGTCYGQSDVPLAPSFEEELKKLKMHLPEAFDAVYSSPLMRCQTLARTLGSKKEIVFDKRLMELNFGDWELKQWDAIPSADLDKWMKDFVHVPAPGGENFSMLYKRAGDFYEEVKGLDCKRIAIVTHAGFVRAMLAKVLELPLKNIFKIPLGYASVTKLHQDQRNDYCGIDYLNKI
jgi:alpha-ribazole phosphatase